MPIKWKVQKYLQKHDVSSYRFQQDTGLSSSVAYSLSRDEHPRVDVRVITKVVPYLRELTGNPKLQIGDVLIYQTEEEFEEEQSARAEREFDAFVQEHGKEWVLKQLDAE